VPCNNYAPIWSRNHPRARAGSLTFLANWAEVRGKSTTPIPSGRGLLHESAPLDVLREQEVRVLQEIVPQVRVALDELGRLPNLNVVGIAPDDLFVMIENMERYHLRPRDALHYAVMVRLGCSDIASMDAHFDRIPALTRYVP
jgi:predicted nucleic acid-binding protein